MVKRRPWVAHDYVKTSRGKKWTSVQFIRFFIVNPHIKRHVTEKHFTVVVTMLWELNKQKDSD